MPFLSVSKEEKLVALNAAKKDLLIHLYKRLTLLGHDPETYNLNDFSFDPSSSEEEDGEFRAKQDIQNTLDKLETVNSKISELS
jgi:hypothetical protein